MFRAITKKDLGAIARYSQVLYAIPVEISNYDRSGLRWRVFNGWRRGKCPIPLPSRIETEEPPYEIELSIWLVTG